MNDLYRKYPASFEAGYFVCNLQTDDILLIKPTLRYVG